MQELDAFYNLKKKIVELSVDNKTIKSLMESLASLEHQLIRPQSEISLEEIDLILSKHREYQSQFFEEKVAGPSKAMQVYVKNEQLYSARRIDWVIAYGKLCTARCNLEEAIANEKTALDRLNSIIS